MIIEKTTKDGLVRYTITSSKHPERWVTAWSDTNGQHGIAIGEGDESDVDMRGDELAMLRQALQFIDGEQHKHSQQAKDDAIRSEYELRIREHGL